MTAAAAAAAFHSRALACQLFVLVRSSVVSLLMWLSSKGEMKRHITRASRSFATCGV